MSILELQMLREKAEAHYKEVADLESKRRLTSIVEKLNAPDYQMDQDAATEKRRGTSSGEWIFLTSQFKEWITSDMNSNPHFMFMVFQEQVSFRFDKREIDESATCF